MYRKLFAFMLLCGATAMIGCSNETEEESASGGAVAPVNQVKLDVTGMTWGINCVAAVKDELQSIPGVSNVNVDFSTNSATFIKGDDYDEETTLEKLDGRGYPSTVAD